MNKPKVHFNSKQQNESTLDGIQPRRINHITNHPKRSFWIISIYLFLILTQLGTNAGAGLNPSQVDSSNVILSDENSENTHPIFFSGKLSIIQIIDGRVVQVNISEAEGSMERWRYSQLVFNRTATHGRLAFQIWEIQIISEHILQMKLNTIPNQADLYGSHIEVGEDAVIMGEFQLWDMITILGKGMESNVLLCQTEYQPQSPWQNRYVRMFRTEAGKDVFDDIRILHAEKQGSLWVLTLEKNVPQYRYEEGGWIVERYGPAKAIFTGQIKEFIYPPGSTEYPVGISIIKPNQPNWDNWINRRIDYYDEATNQYACYSIKDVEEKTIDGSVVWEIYFYHGWDFQKYFAVEGNFTIYSLDPEQSDHQGKNVDSIARFFTGSNIALFIGLFVIGFGTAALIFGTKLLRLKKIIDHPATQGEEVHVVAKISWNKMKDLPLARKILYGGAGALTFAFTVMAITIAYHAYIIAALASVLVLIIGIGYNGLERIRRKKGVLYEPLQPEKGEGQPESKVILASFLGIYGAAFCIRLLLMPLSLNFLSVCFISGCLGFLTFKFDNKILNAILWAILPGVLLNLGYFSVIAYNPMYLLTHLTHIIIFGFFLAKGRKAPWKSIFLAALAWIGFFILVAYFNNRIYPAAMGFPYTDPISGILLLGIGACIACGFALALEKDVFQINKVEKKTPDKMGTGLEGAIKETDVDQLIQHSRLKKSDLLPLMGIATILTIILSGGIFLFERLQIIPVLGLYSMIPGLTLAENVIALMIGLICLIFIGLLMIIAGIQKARTIDADDITFWIKTKLQKIPIEELSEKLKTIAYHKLQAQNQLDFHSQSVTVNAIINDQAMSIQESGEIISESVTPLYTEAIPSSETQELILFDRSGDQYIPVAVEGAIFTDRIVVKEGMFQTTPYTIEEYLVGSVLFMYLDREGQRLFPIESLPLDLPISPEYSTGVKEAIESMKRKLNEKTTHLAAILEKIRSIKNPEELTAILQQTGLEKVVPINLVERYHRPIYYNIEIFNPAAPEIKPQLCRAQVDSDAYTSIIDPDFAEKMRLKPYDTIAIQGAIGGPVNMPLCRLNVRLHGHTTETKVIILPECRKKFQGPFAIGQELFNWDLENRGIKLEED